MSTDQSRSASKQTRLGRAAVLAAVLCSAGLLRGWGLDDPVVTHDESFSWRVTQYPLGDMLLRVGRDGHAPLYFVLLQGWTALCGDSPAALRGLSVLLGVAAVGMIHVLVRDAGRPARGDKASDNALFRGATVAALVAAIHPLPVISSRTARMYSLSAASGTRRRTPVTRCTSPRSGRAT